jgi:phosphoserine phosphatase
MYDLAAYGYIYTYGDSKGDREMLRLGNEQFFKPF